jgi:hypothetical protein
VSASFADAKDLASAVPSWLGAMTEIIPNLRSIRAHGGSQHRAFEELAFQLFTSSVDRDRNVVTRTGNPDAGAEWYVTSSSGEQHAWQAKYIFDIDSLLTAMTESVEAVAKKRPDVKHMTFVIPWNLPDGKGKGRKSARDKYRERVATWKRDVARASEVEFELVGESEITDKLSLAEHRGRIQFFFGEEVLTLASLERRFQECCVVAGRRYRPELQVDLALQDDLEAAGLDGAHFGAIESEREELRRLVGEAREVTGVLAERSKAVIASATVALERLDGCFADPIGIPLRVKEATTLLSGLSLAIEELTEVAEQCDEREKAANDDIAPTSPTHPQMTWSQRSRPLRQLGGPATRLLSLLDGHRTKLVAGSPYFLLGEAGSGKTHLVLDAARRALAAKRPFLVLFGNQFAPGSIWPQLASLVGLPSSISKDALLGTLDACGAAAGNRRFILVIDALNETDVPGFWTAALPELEAAARAYPHLSFGVTVRSTYVDSVDPEHRRDSDFVEVVHPGLVGKEIDATQLYFEHYGIEVPRHPLLTPEFTNPLFLQLYCETFEHDPSPPQGSQSRIKVFERLLRDRIRKVASRLNVGAGDLHLQLLVKEVSAVLDALLDSMANGGSEYVPLSTAMSAAATASTTLDGGRVLSHLESEGVLASSPMWTAGSSQQAVRLTFQAFGDYLLLRRRAERRIAADPISGDTSFVTWLAAASWGIQEAAAVWLPEEHALELRELVDPEMNDGVHGPRLDVMTLETLAFRSSESISAKTIDAINRVIAGPDSWHVDIYHHLCLVAPIPGHPLNGDRFHAHLCGQRMADRDADFGIKVYDALQSEGAFTRLARWASNGPYPTYDQEVVRLAAIPLVWLLSSPNRFMRDWLTKVLVKLLCGHPDVATKLVRDFSKVDDLYVRERLAAIVYGTLMRTPSEGLEDAHRDLVTTTCAAYLRDPLPNALALDHVEGIANLAVSRKLVAEADLPGFTPPLGLKPPARPWTMELIKKRYGYDRTGDDKLDFKFSGIYGSVFSMGDFGRYKIETTFERFSRVALTESRPERTRNRTILNKRRASECLEAADPEVAAAVLTVLTSGPGSGTALATNEQELLAKLLACWERTEIEPVGYDIDQARRWIFKKSIQLGWTPDRFEHFESWRTRDHGRSASKAERFGKKYQWLAYFELLARVRDNFHPLPGYGDSEPSQFQGLWDTFVRDIDPSVPPIRSFDDLTQERGEGDSSLTACAETITCVGLNSLSLADYLSGPRDLLTDYRAYPKAKDLSRAQ